MTPRPWRRRALAAGLLAAAAAAAEAPPAAPPPAGDEIAAAGGPSAEARAAFERGDLASAESLLRGEVAERSADSLTRYLLVRTLVERFALEEALAAAEEGLGAADDAVAHLAAADVLLPMGHFEAAERQYREALRLDPELARAHLGLGRVLRTAAMRASAAAEFREAHRLAPDDPDVLLALAGVAERPAEAVPLLRRYLERAGAEPQQRRAAVASWVEMLSALGDRQLCAPRDPARGTVVDLAAPDPNQLALPLAINGGRPFPVLLDTGASGLLLDRKLAARHEVTVLTEMEFGGVGDWGALSGASGLAATVRAGDVELTDCPVGLAGTRFRIGEKGLVGTDLFADYLVTIDFPARRLTLEPLPGGDGAVAARDRTLGPEHQDFVPVRLWGGDLLVETTLDDRERAWFLLDTGAQFNVLAVRLASRLGQLRRYTQVGVRGVSGDVLEVYQLGRRVSLAFAGFLQDNDGLLALDLEPRNEAVGVRIGGVIGHEFLRHFVVSIDYRNGMVRFARPAP